MAICPSTQAGGGAPLPAAPKVISPLPASRPAFMAFNGKEGPSGGSIHLPEPEIPLRWGRGRLRKERSGNEKAEGLREGRAAFKNGAPGRIRTSDLLVRSQALYPAELRAHIAWKQLGKNNRSRPPKQPAPCSLRCPLSLPPELRPPAEPESTRPAPVRRSPRGAAVRGSLVRTTVWRRTLRESSSLPREVPQHGLRKLCESAPKPSSRIHRAPRRTGTSHRAVS